MLFFPITKVNIGLNVVSKRSDGYHNIETIFCPIDLADVLEFVPAPERNPGDIQFSASGIPIEGPEENNLCIKAYRILNTDFNLPAIDVHLHKIVPPGSGLGGGSSDAAFMLKNLNTHFILNLDEDALCGYASRIGSDCAFFVRNRPLFGFERGNVFREIPLLPQNIEIVVINPGIHVSTAEAYAGVSPKKPSESLEDLITLPLAEWKNRIRNDFEASIITRYPAIGNIKKKLYELGAAYASMSGSGSSVYGLFSQPVSDLQDDFPGLFYWKGKIMQRGNEI